MTEATFVSLLPIVLTLLVSIVTRNVIIGLFSGTLLGVLLLNGVNPLSALDSFISHYLVGQVTDSYNAGVIILLVFIGGFVNLVEKSGGGPAFANSVTQYINSKTKGIIAAWFGGILLFFSDIGTPLIVGPIFQPLFDRMKISREKLAFIIDSTASPVAILVPFIGWAVYVMSLIDKEIKGLADSQTSLTLFMQAIPFQAYAILAVAFIPLMVLRNIEFGPMTEAERKVDKKALGAEATDSQSIFSHSKAKPSFVFIPLLVLFITLLSLLVSHGFPFQPVAGTLFRSALSTAYFFASVTLIGLMSYYGVRSLLVNISLYLNGMNGVMQIAIILVLAWTLSVIGKDMGAPQYISGIVTNNISAWTLPTLIFILGGLISFATGSSWGTFAIMFPLFIPAAIGVEANLALVIAAILSGGLWGDHCSPISDSTILASTGAGCGQFEHFRTQLPYAVFNGGLSILFYLACGVYPHPAMIGVFIALQFGLMCFLSKWLSKPQKIHSN